MRRFSGVADFIPAKLCAELTGHDPGALETQFIGQLTYGLMLEDHGLHTNDQNPKATSPGSIKPSIQVSRTRFVSFTDKCSRNASCDSGWLLFIRTSITKVDRNSRGSDNLFHHRKKIRNRSVGFIVVLIFVDYIVSGSGCHG